MNKNLKNRLLDTRLLLFAGFSSLLLMPAFAFLWAERELNVASREIQAVRVQYLEINKLLNELKIDVINSGTFLRDFLLDPDSDAAELQRQKLSQVKQHAETLLAAKKLQESGAAYRSFLAAYTEYWRAIDPVLNWDVAQRRREGLGFLRAEAFARRSAMLELATQIGAWNDLQLAEGERQIEEILRGVGRTQQRGMVVMLITGVLLASFVFWRVNSLEREASNRLLQAELARQESRDLSLRLLTVQEEERKSISRELHDGIAQNLSALQLGVQQMAREVDEVHSRPLLELASITEETLKLTRNLSLVLRPSMLDDLGLVPALRWLARESMRSRNVVVDVDATEDLDNLAEPVRICVFRVVQEALNNALRHADPARVTIEVSRREKGLLVTVRDDGRSFDVTREKGMGIVGMTERVEKLGGRFSIVSTQGVGTVVTAELP